MIGALTRTVADTATVLDVLAGYELGDATWAPPPPAPFAELATRQPGRLRVGRSAVPPVSAAEVHPDCVAAYEAASQLLKELGHEVEDF